MSNDHREAQLTTLLEGSRRMLALARDGDWTAVSQLQAKQHAAVERIFTEPVAPADAAYVAENIMAVMDINEQIAALGREARKGCLQEAGEQQQRRHALQQYTVNSK